MADTYARKQRREFDRQDEADGFQMLHRVFEVGLGSTLARVDLELGDWLPEDSSAEILASRIVRDKKYGDGQFIEVTARKILPWED